MMTTKNTKETKEDDATFIRLRRVKRGYIEFDRDGKRIRLTAAFLRDREGKWVLVNGLFEVFTPGGGKRLGFAEVVQETPYGSAQRSLS